MMRTILARYTDQPPEIIQFAHHAHGKPYLPDHPHIHFNLSHAEDYGLLAVASRRVVGVDIEYIRQEFADPLVARHFFSAMEQKALEAWTGEQYADAFFACWTRKEAYIKALGSGLAHPLHLFDVTVDPSICDLLAMRPDQGEKCRWQMSDIIVPENYCACVVVQCECDQEV